MVAPQRPLRPGVGVQGRVCEAWFRPSCPTCWLILSSCFGSVSRLMLGLSGMDVRLLLWSKRIICRLLQDHGSEAACSCTALVHALWLMLCCFPECIFNG